MGRRKTVSNRMRDAVADQDAWEYAWALLEIARLEYRETKEFNTIEVRDIKQLINAMLNQSKGTAKDDDTSVSLDMKDYLELE